MRNDLILINDKFENNDNFNVNELLFQFKFQERPSKIESINERVGIIKCICRFVVRSKRFNNENIKTNVFKKLCKSYIEDEDVLYDFENEFNFNEKEDENSEEINIETDSIEQIIELNDKLEKENGEPMLLDYT